MKKTIEPRALSANRANHRDRISPRASSFEQKQSRKDHIRQLNTEEYLDLLPRKTSQSKTKKSCTNTNINLPEFQNFQSDHLVLLPKIVSHPFYDRLRGSSAFTVTKFNRQSTNNNSSTNNNNNNNNTLSQAATTVTSTGSPRASYSSVKRLSRSRQTYDTTNSHDQEQTHIMRPSCLRQMTNKFDSIACFHEVSRLVIFFSDSFARASTIHCPRGKRDEHENAHIPNKFDYNRE